MSPCPLRNEMPMPLPTMMRHVVAREPGPPDVLTLTDGPVPQPRSGEVLIEVAAAGVNRPDCLQRAGAYPPPPDASPIIGLEVAGTIVACGEGVTEWRVGDQVCALTPGGGYAEYCTTPAGFCLPIPNGLTKQEAASLPETFFTVWNNLVDRGRLRRGETVLIHGGTGRHRPHRDPDRATLRRDGDRHRRQRREGGVLCRNGRRACDQLPDARFRRRGRTHHRRSAASMSCSTWSAATTSRRT